MDNNTTYWCLVTKLNEGKNLEDDWLPFWRDVCLTETQKEDGIVTYEMHHNKEHQMNCCFEEFKTSEDVITHMINAGPKIGPTFASLVTPQKFNQCGTRITDGQKKLGEGHDIAYFSKKVDGSFRRKEYHIPGEEDIRYELIYNVKAGTSVEQLTGVIKPVIEKTFKNVPDCVLNEYFVPEETEDEKEYQLVCHVAYKNSIAIANHWKFIEPHRAAFNEICNLAPGPLNICGPLTGEVYKLMKGIATEKDIIIFDRLDGRIKR